MEVISPVALPVHDGSQVGEARREAARLAGRLGLDETDVGRVALLATELAGNLVKHATRGGELIVRPLDGGGVELLALDRAPGMSNVGLAMRDGFSTSGTPGTGLGAAARVADLFDIHSIAGRGTALVAWILARGDGEHAPGNAVDLGLVTLPKRGEQVIGDGWALEEEAGRVVLMVVDGLGHGPGAAEAAREAERVFRAHRGRAPAERLERIHEALRSTRGAAVSIAEVELARRQVRYVGVGNISGVLASADQTRSMVSHNGTAGAEARKIQEFTYEWPEGAVLVMHSDGLNTRWTLDDYPGLMARHPALMAGVLYRDFCRGRDDVTVAVVREARRRVE